MTGQGEMQGPRSHVDDANSSLAKAQASGATVAEEVAGATVQPEGTELRSEAHRRHAHKLTAGEWHVLGLGPRRCGPPARPGELPCVPLQ